MIGAHLIRPSIPPPPPALPPTPQDMSLRDYFAAKSLAGILMNYTTAKFGATEQTVAEYAYRYADAMLRAREAKP